MKNVYNQVKSQQTISLNSHYSVVFRNDRDASQFCTMAYQICLNDGKVLVDSFTNATYKPYGVFGPRPQPINTWILDNSHQYFTYETAYLLY